MSEGQARRQGVHWRKKDDAELRGLVDQDLAPKQIAGIMGRSPGSIRSRIKHMDLRPKGMTKQAAVEVVIKAMQHRMKGDYGHDLSPEEFWISAEEIVDALADAGMPVEGK